MKKQLLARPMSPDERIIKSTNASTANSAAKRFRSYMRIADFLNEDTVLVKPKKGKKKSLMVRHKFIIKDGN